MKLNYVDKPTRSILSLDQISDTHYKITRVSVLEPNRRQGIASRLLRECVKDADIGGITLSLEIVPSATSIEERDEMRDWLMKWYESFGFKPSLEHYEKGFIWRRNPTSHPLFRDALRSVPALTPKHLKRLAEACIDELVRRGEQ